MKFIYLLLLSLISLPLCASPPTEQYTKELYWLIFIQLKDANGVVVETGVSLIGLLSVVVLFGFISKLLFGKGFGSGYNKGHRLGLSEGIMSDWGNLAHPSMQLESQNFYFRRKKGYEEKVLDLGEFVGPQKPASKNSLLSNSGKAVATGFGLVGKVSR